jgi:hypothetical protein
VLLSIHHDSAGRLVVRLSPACEDVNADVEGTTALKAVTRQRLVTTQQAEDLVSVVVNSRVGELAIAL